MKAIQTFQDNETKQICFDSQQYQQTPLDDVVTIKTLQAEYPHLFTKPQLSWLLKTRHKNGLEQLGAILKISRKLYIKKSIFITWFLAQKTSNS
jgi:hypothetical protein